MRWTWYGCHGLAISALRMWGTLFTVGALSACSVTAEEPSGGELTVFAAASLQDVFEDLETAWQVNHPDVELRIAHDGSNILAAQIGEGAPADVFVSADLARPQRLIEVGEALGDVVHFADNQITLVAPLDDHRVAAPSDLAEPGVRFLAAAPGVPISAYAERALELLAATMPDPGAFRAAVEANVVSREDNVRAALAKVELGEGDAAFVYATDLASAEGVREVDLPATVAVTAEYGAVQVSERAIAGEFVAWLAGDDAGRVLGSAGFTMPAS